MINPVRNGDVSAAFQYRERYVEGCNPYIDCVVEKIFACFNTENGMWRAAIWDAMKSAKSISKFQYRERYVEGCNVPHGHKDGRCVLRFNTENGMWRAAILCP